MLITCTFLLAVMTLGEARSSPIIELLEFGNGDNNLIVEEFFIPKPKPVDTKRKGKTALGLECFCLKDSGSLYLPPIINEDCICKKNCCKNRPPNHYLPPEDCEICPNCICDKETYTLINKESGNCPICRPPSEKKCECRSGKYINEELGNCPKPCNPPPCRCINGQYVDKSSGNCPDICIPPSPPPCQCRNGRLYNEESGNCPQICEPPPCLCVNGRFINKESGNCPAKCDPLPCVCRNGRLINTDSGDCPPCLPNCSCYKGELINKERGTCPTYCPYYEEKPEDYGSLPTEFL